MAYKDYQKQLAANRKHYTENKQYYKNKARRRAKQLRLMMDEYKASHPCTDCRNYFPPECMDFDHARGDKKFVLSHSESHSKQKVKDEMAKCDLVCANCHRIRTKHRARRSTEPGHLTTNQEIESSNLSGPTI